MQIILGIIFHFIGGAASGSFYVPYNKVKGWHWESFWIIGGLFSWLIIPPIAAWLTVPHFAEIISQTPASTFGWTYFWGVLWGIGGLMYGLGMRYLGMSLGNSVLLGFTSAFGALAPSIYYNFHPQAGKTTFHDLLTNSWGQIVLIGIILCLAGIFICGKAGVSKERELSEEKKQESIKEFNLVKGLIVCIVAGILSACFNYGIEAGSKMAEVANTMWKTANPTETGNFLYRNNVIYIVLLWGGLTTNFIWTMFLNFRNKSFADYTNKKTPLLRNYIFCAVAGTLWFLQFFFYGMGESKLGNGASSWILHMSFIILVANMWGFALKEWKGVSKKTRTTIIIGVITIILSVILVGYGNSLKSN
ncbi:L-rhamnose/proton symporter RhaT [Ginsengibacter hankyongi]|uniref:L-rhamnose/proton symporter RhaT n=1 Tax=Ginsengibacter hankyongi TaxID=2607284 RepID=A0A5J5IDA3_9BACT|nr:L-rhamnose/proton symporter RhaT [Ginsengibacter hankyongi]KAA9037592.1 L-rhamnose/proton symporter RhaT [Ginsengibacter hankyongi]